MNSRISSLFLILLLMVCLGPRSACSQDRSRSEADSTASVVTGNITKLTDNGGRVAWYHGTAHDLIALDAISDRRSQNTDIYVMRPDGSEKRCVTCDSDVPKGFTGQMAWYPDGEFLVLQAENSNSTHSRYNHGAWGINQDLWIVRKDGKMAERIYHPTKHGGALHPHFSHDGKKLVFAERTPTGRSYPRLKRITPGGENNWTGWQIHIADFDMSKSGENKLSNHRTLRPNGHGMYETHGFTPDGRLMYSYTAGGRAYVDDVYTCREDGKDIRNVTESKSTWDEHGSYSPDGSKLAFMSSRVRPSVEFPKAKPVDLVTELYVRYGDGPPVQVTDMNERLPYDCVISDFDWDSTGSRIVFQVATFKARKSPQLWMVEIPETEEAARNSEPGRPLERKKR